MNIVVRRAVSQDLAAIAEFTRDTFQWGDYVSASFLEWLDDEDSAEFVAVQQDDRPIGLARVVQLSEHETWAHAARVHADHRRQGVGLALQRAGMEWSRGRGALVNRLMTESSNEVARGQVAKAGYREVAAWFHASRRLGDDIADGGPPPQALRQAALHDVESAIMAWSNSDLARQAHGLFPLGWHLRSIRIGDIAAQARDGRLWEAPAGWVTIQPGAGQPDQIWISWMVTIADDAYAFVRAIVAKVHRSGAKEVSAMLPATPWMVSAFEHARFKIQPNIIWEKLVD